MITVKKHSLCLWLDWNYQTVSSPLKDFLRRHWPLIARCKIIQYERDSYDNVHTASTVVDRVTRVSLIIDFHTMRKITETWRNFCLERQKKDAFRNQNEGLKLVAVKAFNFTDLQRWGCSVWGRTCCCFYNKSAISIPNRRLCGAPTHPPCAEPAPTPLQSQTVDVQDLGHPGRLSPPAHPSHKGTCPSSDVIVQMCGGHGLSLLSAHWLQPLNPLCAPLSCSVIHSTLCLHGRYFQNCRR